MVCRMMRSNPNVLGRFLSGLTQRQATAARTLSLSLRRPSLPSVHQIPFPLPLLYSIKPSLFLFLLLSTFLINYSLPSLPSTLHSALIIPSLFPFQVSFSLLSLSLFLPPLHYNISWTLLVYFVPLINFIETMDFCPQMCRP